MDSTETKPRTRVVKLISEHDIKQSMTDPKFYEALPEFLPLRAKMEAMKAGTTASRGCTPCALRRVYNSLASNYMATLAALSPDGARRVRAYFGADELRAVRVNPTTRKTETIRL